MAFFGRPLPPCNNSHSQNTAFIAADSLFTINTNKDIFDFEYENVYY